jgi:hypothetical protein
MLDMNNQVKCEILAKNSLKSIILSPFLSVEIYYLLDNLGT